MPSTNARIETAAWKGEEKAPVSAARSVYDGAVGLNGQNLSYGWNQFGQQRNPTPTIHRQINGTGSQI